jgi:hypothetical protein
LLNIPPRSYKEGLAYDGGGGVSMVTGLELGGVVGDNMDYK